MGIGFRVRDTTSWKKNSFCITLTWGQDAFFGVKILFAHTHKRKNVTVHGRRGKNGNPVNEKTTFNVANVLKPQLKWLQIYNRRPYCIRSLEVSTTEFLFPGLLYQHHFSCFPHSRLAGLKNRYFSFDTVIFCQSRYNNNTILFQKSKKFFFYILRLILNRNTSQDWFVFSRDQTP